MKITIQKLGLRTGEVYFTAECGEGRGIWAGGPVKPGEELEAEFELPMLFMRWVDLVPVSSNEYGMRQEGAETVLTGVLENIEEDGTGYLRLGPELIMFECLGEPMALGGYVELRTPELGIYPVLL
ncbi:hypothetical protein C2I18_14845 [Paenibacillus sp. PK3_47]|uniref:hypothetical protein n=1 Tax=Paenibacillus sp. PK3_47 TaxID=2072642 RepID=UPI00201D2EB0|nr:hypothetical protein [Paenibacillus sp. PK3_47]UQZ34689.1 hypothetical protein C2I18_14845 [Paenibacillus sp. PK3_47]